LKRYFLLFIVYLFTISSGYSQQAFQHEFDIEAFVEELFAFQEEDISYEDLYESLLQVHLHPIDLQNATADELQSLFILSPLQIKEFLAYRENFGPLLAIHELQAVPQWDLPTIYKIMPFVSLSTNRKTTGPANLKKLLGGENAYLIVRQRRFMETRKGYIPRDSLQSNSPYLGDPNDIYARLRIQQPGDFSFGITLDKDAGEQFTWDPNTKRYGFNFLSYHYTLYDRGNWKRLTVGDYQFQFGQGLVYGSGFSVGKGAETISTVRRSTLGVRPYTSVLESGFFRGAAATYQIGQWEITGMYSNAPRDANIQIQLDTLEVANEYLSSLILSGMHRTENEIGNKAQARERNIGGNIHYQSRDKSFQTGTNHLYTKYSRPFFRRDRIYNRFEFRGTENRVHSIYFSYNIANHFLFGETAFSRSGGMGSVLGIMSSLNAKLDFSALWRKFTRNYHSFYGNAFSENSRPINEEGLYLGVHFRPTPKISWSASYDHFRFPWMRFRVYAPSSGKEWLTRISYKPDKKVSMFFQWREETKSRNLLASEQNQPFYQLVDGKRKNFVFNLDYLPSQWWQAKSRVQFSSFDFNGSQTKGYAIIQDLNGVFGPWKLGGRVALFDTEDFENRQYVYEKNVLWAFSIPNYYGQGIRYYLLAQWKISKNITAWARWARTTYTNRNSIGSGLQEIEGNKITESTFQIRYRFNK